MENNEPTFSTEAQRRELDIMSAKLLDNLNTMIAEQEARVQEFSLQQPPSLQSTPEPVRWQRTDSPVPTLAQNERTVIAPQRETTREVPPPRKHSVTPPPAAAPKKTTQRMYQAPPPLPRSAGKPAARGEKKKESSVGCGTIALGLLILSVLMKACD